MSDDDRSPGDDSEPAPAASDDPALAPAPATVEAVTGIEACDQYLSLYERCEAVLKPEIMAGDRRPVHAEKGWVEHLSSTPEKETLPQACTEWLAELRPRCPEPAAG